MTVKLDCGGVGLSAFSLGRNRTAGVSARVPADTPAVRFRFDEKLLRQNTLKEIRDLTSQPERAEV